MNHSFVVAAAPRIDELDDTDLDGIIDMRLFNHDAWCNGRGVPADGHFQYRCLACGSVEERNLTAYFFDISEPHPRLIPRYTSDAACSWLIVKEIQQQRKEVRLAFTRRIVAQLCQRGYTFVPLSKITTRIIAVAALEAIGAINQAGYVIGRGEVMP